MKYVNNHIKVVLFDHDDTLVGTIGSKWDEHKFIAKKYYNKTITDNDIKAHWGKPFAEMICLLYDTDDAEQAIDYNLKHHTEFEKTLFSATVPVLRHLKERGMKLGIITATTRISFEHDLELHEIPKDLLSYTQTSEETQFHKPDPRVFEPVLKWLDEEEISSDEVLYIGDGLHDMKAAVGAGFNFLGVQTGLVSAEEFASVNAQSITSISDML
jgi:HAD superfamily hydrolase (TIGR01549 family)